MKAQHLIANILSHTPFCRSAGWEGNPATATTGHGHDGSRPLGGGGAVTGTLVRAVNSSGPTRGSATVPTGIQEGLCGGLKRSLH